MEKEYNIISNYNKIPLKIFQTWETKKLSDGFNSLTESWRQKNPNYAYFLYDKDDRIKKYSCVNDILKEFYFVRLKAYTTRKNYYLDKYKKELDALKWKMKFIEEVLDDKIVVYRKKRDEIIAQLTKKKYPILDNDSKYDYLLSLPIHSFTYEKIEELKEKITNKEEEIHELDSKDEKELWEEELNELREAYVKEYNPIATNVSKTIAKVSKVVPIISKTTSKVSKNVSKVSKK
jgi:DNA gyrase/topoisomerase IV subunit A